MAGSKSDYLENALLDHVLGGPNYVRPSNMYVALFNVAPDDTGGGTECSQSGYARVEVTNNDTNWPGAVDGVKSNGEVITFPEAGEAWTPVVAVGLFDESTGGNLLFWSELGAPVTVNAGDIAKIAAGAFVITED